MNKTLVRNTYFNYFKFINKMKKHLLLLSLVSIAITVFGQNSIPNGNFETWTSGTFDYPQNYQFTSNVDAFFRYMVPFNAVKTTDAFHGTYAVQINTVATATDTSFGYFLNINPNNGNPYTWSGGMPYTQKPTGIRGHYKYNVASADSATIIVSFSKAGINIGAYIYKIGGFHTSWNLFDFTFSPALSVIPDAVIFAAASSNIMASNGIPGSTLIIDSVSFTGVNSQPALMNGDFESWQTQTLYKPIDWYFENNQGDAILRTNDVVAGNFAIELKTFLGNNNNNQAAQAAQISTGYYDNSCHCMKGGYAFTNQIDTLAFYYKYAPANISDSACVSVSFIKYGSYIWGSGINLPSTTGNYKYMEIPFNTWQSPDSAIVQVQSSLWKDSALTYVGADLKIDEMHFKSQPLHTGIFNLKNDNTINIFPNPASENLTIKNPNTSMQNYVITIKNIQGQEVLNENINFSTTHSIDVGTLRNGVYILSLQNEKDNYVSKIVIKR